MLWVLQEAGWCSGGFALQGTCQVPWQVYRQARQGEGRTMEPAPRIPLTEMSLTFLSPSSCHLQVTQDLHTSTSLPASPHSRQATNKSRRSKKGGSRVTHKRYEPPCLSRKIRSGNTNISWCNVQNGGLQLTAHTVRVLHFLAGCPEV